MEMPVLNRFLVPVDGSESSRRAKRYAIALAQKCGATIVLFHAHGLFSARISPQGREQIVRRNLDRIGKAFAIYEEACRKAGVRCETVVRHGAPAEAIVDAAQELGCGLIVMGIGRAGALLPLPTVSAKVRAHSPVPVVIVGDECDGASQGLGQWRFAPARHLQQAC